jgi:hypothetical protein
VIFLLNYERVRLEMVELTRFRIAQVLHVDPSDVEVTATHEDGKISRAWTVKKLPEGLDPEKARRIATEVGRYLNERYLIPRLKDAQMTAREARSGSSQAKAKS